MKIYIIIYISITFLFTSCTSPDEYFKQSIIDKDLRAAYINHDNSIKQERSSLLFVGDSSATNCDSYLELFARNYLLETVDNQMVKSEYLVCDALKILASSEIYAGNIDAAKIGSDLLNKLDIRSFPSSLARTAENSSFTLNNIFPNQSFSKLSSAIYESDDWFFSVKVVAVSNINDNLLQDWILFLSDESKVGNYRGYSTLIIYDPEHSEVLKANLFNKQLLTSLSKGRS